MKTKLLPLIWWCGGLFGALAIAVTAKAAKFEIFEAIILAWVGMILTGLLAGIVALRIKPELRYSTTQQIDGLGHLHQWTDFVITATAIMAIAALVASRWFS